MNPDQSEGTVETAGQEAVHQKVTPPPLPAIPRDTARERLTAFLLIPGTAAGIIGQFLVYDAHLGLNFLLFVVALALVGGWAAWKVPGRILNPAALWPLGAALILSGFVAVREYPALVAMNMTAVICLLGLAAVRLSDSLGSAVSGLTLVTRAFFQWLSAFIEPLWALDDWKDFKWERK